MMGWSERWITSAMALVLLGGAASPLVGQQRFADDFEDGLSGWEIAGDRGVYLLDSGDPEHGSVMVLHPWGDVYALVRESEAWGGVRMEGDVLFPDDEHNYLGMVYAFQKSGERTDFGLIYIKGNGSYLRVNPHRDFNVGRTLYEEYRTELTDDAAIVIDEWQRFRLEVIDGVAHLYVGAMDVPQLTFAHLELDSGAVGLQPRSVGGDVWVDNVTVSSIDDFSYRGPPLPAHEYQPDSVLTEWTVAGPFAQTMDEFARHPAAFPDRWRDFETDDRGAVVSASVVDYHGARPVAYFQTLVDAQEAGSAFLHLSTVDDLAVWVNGRFHWFMDRDPLAWWDFWFNEEHSGQRIPIELREGSNDVVIRVRGGVYATGGFFARVEG